MTSDPEGAMAELKKLMEDPKSELGVRTGDVYALIVEHYANRGEVQQALAVLEEMRKYIPTKNLNKYLTPEVIDVSST
jgi:pentatricopeptide repeat protein